MKLASALYDSFYPFDKFEGLFTDFYCAVKPVDLQPDSVLVVWGGADISPSLYNKPVSTYTNADEKLSHRDYGEWSLMNRAKDMGLPIIGVCRGAQMLCALAGGHLIQDTTGHTSSHDMETNDGRVIKTSSLHHQMLYPFDVEHVMLATAKKLLSNHYIDVNEFGADVEVSMPCEPEAVWFPKVKGLAVQGHPEFMHHQTAYNKWMHEKIKELVC